mmetsp:Transcript_65981/g.104479  ORF Transcript_65981/g.104479 Transcript_65981/m.104479 type:complete len:154 (-) Transcript_65981:60-521(-)
MVRDSHFVLLAILATQAVCYREVHEKAQLVFGHGSSFKSNLSAVNMSENVASSFMAELDSSTGNSEEQMGEMEEKPGKKKQAKKITVARIVQCLGSCESFQSLAAGGACTAAEAREEPCKEKCKKEEKCCCRWDDASLYKSNLYSATKEVSVK